MDRHKLDRLLDTALAHHRAGRLREADAGYRQLLTLAPDHVGALGLLGQLALQAGQPAQALVLLDRAITQQPGNADLHSARGSALKALGRIDEAVVSLQIATRCAPREAGLHFNLGNALREADQMAEAMDAYRRAIALDPSYWHAHNNLGHALTSLFRYAEAVESFRVAVALNRDVAELHYNLAAALQRAGDPATAVDSLREVVRLAPGEAEHHHALGTLLGLLGQVDAGAASYQAALRLRPDEAAWHTELGFLLLKDHRSAEAEVHFNAACRLAPGQPNYLHNLADCLMEAGREAEAVIRYDEALGIDPEHARARYGRAMVELVNGRLQAGWAGYEARFEAWLGGRIVLEGSPWLGNPVGDSTVLLVSEQGLGDTIQFCRYVPLVAARARVVFVVPPPLMRLMSTLAGGAALVPHGTALPPYDWYCPLLSLPRVFGTTLESIPAEVPYLSVDPAQRATWQTRLAGCGGLRVGLVWAGTPGHTHDDRRSISPALFDSLGGIPGVTFISLQKSAERHPAVIDHDWMGEIDDFTDTAALISALDLVVSVDTSVAHLAGALGRPVWLLNRLDTDWRWLRERSDSPWYPTLRQFRQKRWGDWEAVLAAVRAALVEAAAGGVLKDRRPRSS